jgi:signal transduction histidine kinase
MWSNEIYLGSVHAIWTPARPGFDALVLAAFARHMAVAIAARRLYRNAGLLQDRVERAEAVLNLTDAVSTRGFPELLGRTQEAVRRVFGAVDVGVSAWDEEHQILTMLPGSFGGIDLPVEWTTTDPGDARSSIARVFSFGRSDLSNTPAADAGVLHGIVEALDIRSLLVVPLIFASHPTGVLLVANRPNGFDIAHLRECEFIARQVAVAVELTVTLLRLREQGDVDRLLSAASLMVADPRSVEEALPGVLERLRAVTGANVAALVPTDAPPLVVRAPTASDDRNDALVAFPQPEEVPDGEAADQSGPADFSPEMVAEPVIIAGRRHGTLWGVSAHGTRFGALQRRAFARTANLVALAWAGQRDLEQRTALALHEERERLADELHDEVAQLLFAAQISLEQLAVGPDLPDGVRAEIERVGSLLDRGEEAVRRVIRELPLRSYARLTDRLADIVVDIRTAFLVEVELTVAPEVTDGVRQVPGVVDDTVVKVARECLVNVAKHAGRCRAWVTLDTPEAGLLRLCVEDDGVGIGSAVGTAGPGHGLASLRRTARDRGGELTIDRRDWGGTSVELRVPWTPSPLDDLVEPA